MRVPHVQASWAISLAALLLVFFPSARGAARETTARQVARDIERSLDQWDVKEAQLTAEAHAGLEQSRDASTLAALARLRFHLGDYQGAMSRLQRIGDGRSASQRRLLRLIERTMKTTAGYRERASASGNFRVRTLPGPDALLVDFVIETLERMRVRMRHELGYAPTTPLVVEIYPQVADLARVSPLTAEEIRRSGTIALCKYNRLMIVSPRALLRGYPWRDTLAHEYVHLVVSAKSKNLAPIWLHEGLAKFLETRWRDESGKPPPLAPAQRHLLADALARRKLISWQRMHPSMAKLPDQKSTALAFAQVQTAIALIAARGDDGQLRRLVALIGAGTQPWDAVRRTTGLRRRAFTAAWKRQLKAMGLRRLPGYELQKKRFGKAPGSEQEIARIRAKKAREHFRLADMLRRRQLTTAAIVEYRKAAALISEHDVFVRNALARAYLETDQPKQAIATIRPVVDYYPDLAGPQVTLGLAYLRTSNAVTAVRHLEVALRINPFDPQVHCGLSEALASGADKERHSQLCAQLHR